MKARSQIFIVAGLALLCAIAYSNSFYKDFQYDDIRLIRFNFSLRDWHNWKPILLFEPFRPLTTMTFAANFAISGKNTWSYHLFNLTLHFLNVAVFFVLLRRNSYNDFFSIISAALMAAHPLNTESVTYISSRSILLCAFFFLMSLLFFDSYLRKPRPWFVANSFLCFFFALLSKEEAIVLPLAALLYNFAFFGSDSIKKHRTVHVAMFAIVIAGGIIRLHSHIENAGISMPMANYLATELSVWVRYLWLAVFPVDLNVSHSVSLITLTHLRFFLSSCVLLVIFYFLIKLRHPAPIVFFWGFWFFLNLLPSSIVPLREVMAEHRTYISLFGFCATIGYLIPLFTKSGPSRIITASLIFQILFYTGVTIRRNEVWQNEVSLWSDSVKKAPLSIRSHLNLGAALIRDFQFDQAASEYLFALSMGARMPVAYNGLGFCYLNERNLVEAEKNFRIALKLDPDFTDSQTGLGIVYYQQRKCKEALYYFQQVYEKRKESAQLVQMMSECRKSK